MAIKKIVSKIVTNTLGNIWAKSEGGGYPFFSTSIILIKKMTNHLHSLSFSSFVDLYLQTCFNFSCFDN